MPSEQDGPLLFSGWELQAQHGAWPEADGRVGCGAMEETTMGWVAHAGARLSTVQKPQAHHTVEATQSDGANRQLPSSSAQGVQRGWQSPPLQVPHGAAHGDRLG